MAKKHFVYLSLGGNTGVVIDRFQKAFERLSNHPGICHLTISPLYHTAPFEADTEDWFVNAVCSFETLLSPLEIFQFTQLIEKELGKTAKEKRASRPIDIDLLFYDSEVYEDHGLAIPHPRWKERLFVLIPLSDLIEKMTIDEPLGKQCYDLRDLIQANLNRTTPPTLLSTQIRRIN